MLNRCLLLCLQSTAFKRILYFTGNIALKCIKLCLQVLLDIAIYLHILIMYKLSSSIQNLLNLLLTQFLRFSKIILYTHVYKLPQLNTTVFIAAHNLA